MIWDVAVVGASAAGLFTAAHLARAGARVLVLERAPSIDPAPRALIATGRLRELLNGVGDRAIGNRIRTFHLTVDGCVTAVELDDPDLIVERSVLIRELARDAQEAGAELVLGRRFVGFEADARRLAIVSEDARTRRRRLARVSVLVGADGAFSRVARAAGWPGQATVPLLQAVVCPPSDARPDVSQVWFRPRDTSYFYWLIPEAADRAVVGLIGRERSEVRAHLDYFLAEHGLVPIGYQAARVPLFTSRRPVAQKIGAVDVYLVGDAAGHVKATTVGGLVTGFRGARAVVGAILGTSCEDLRALHWELERHRLLRRLLDRFTERDYTRLLGVLGPGAHRVLEKNSRDETKRLLWRLGLQEPRLVGMALAAALRGPARLP